MTILDLLTYPDSVLKKKSVIVEKIDDDFRQFLDDMVETMYHDKGCGLAAVQVGVLKRALTLDLTGMDEQEREEGFYPLKIINPKIVRKSDEKTCADEGCLSLPEQRFEITRPEKIAVEYFDENGDQKTLECDGWLARAMQHEIDHLDGKLMIDYLSPLKRDFAIKKLIKMKQQ